MGFLGKLIYVASVVFAVYLGYLGDKNYIILLIIPLGLLCGQIMQRASQSSDIFRRHGFGVLVELITMYFVGVVVSVIGYGIGLIILEILKHRPEGF